jgi:ABC-type multidrug transport system ATPase subunit
VTGLGIEARRLCRRTPSGRTVLQEVDLTIQPGELVVIAGGSGAGKTSLLEVLAGLARLEQGQVLLAGTDVHREAARFRSVLGYVPQDDIVHEELPLERTLRYAAALRLPGASRAEVDRAVTRSMAELDLTEHADTRVAALSGGQRKRASIAVELLTGPRVFFLDEPTSGLDPATGAALLALLRRLADGGSTVVLTSHAVQDLAAGDRLVFLTAGGRLAFSGTAQEALDHFGVDGLDGVYRRLAFEQSPEHWAKHWADRRAGERAADGVPADPPSELPAPGPPTGALRQWQVLTRRTAATLFHDRLTMAILLGSPAMVVAMFAVLFQPGAFDAADPSPTAVIMIVFWIAFGVFFFGLTYGLLQICTEFAILRRERLVGLRLGPYILAKTAVLIPFLLMVDVLMLAVLRILDRLPHAGLGTYASLTVTLLLDAAAALALGLLASAAVPSPAQATLTLPMLCFPAVLFSGAIVPVPVMAWLGRALSVLMPDRWAFEGIGVDLGVRRLFAHGGSPLGPPLLAAYGHTGSEAVSTYWLILVLFTLTFTAGTWWVLARRTRSLTR